MGRPRLRRTQVSRTRGRAGVALPPGLVLVGADADRARRVAQNADGAAYSDAVSVYAALGRDELREAARWHGGYFGSRLNTDFDQK
jgi:hypothetical protein